MKIISVQFFLNFVPVQINRCTRLSVPQSDDGGGARGPGGRGGAKPAPCVNTDHLTTTAGPPP